MRGHAGPKRSSLLWLTLLAAGCAALFDKVPQNNMAPRLSYQGFSFNRPNSPNWYLLRSEEHYTNVTLRREFMFPSDTHSFYASASLGRIDKQPDSPEEFAELVRSKGQVAPYDIRTVSYEQVPTVRQNQWCIRFESSYVVVGPPVAPHDELTMINRGFRCLHPAWPQTTLDFFYSERGLPAEMDPTLSREGEEFLDGVRIDVAPNTPAS